MRSAPDSVTTSARLLRLPPLPDVPEPHRGVPVFAVDGVAIDERDGQEQLRATAPPLLDTWDRVPAAAVRRVHGDPERPVPGIGDHSLLGELDEQGIDALLAVAGDGAVGHRPRLPQLRRAGRIARRGFDPATYRHLMWVRAKWDPQARFVASHEIESGAGPV
jgi:hypothetical protein